MFAQCPLSYDSRVFRVAIHHFMRIINSLFILTCYNMTWCPKCQISIACKGDSIQWATCNMVTHLKCSKMDKNNFEYPKTIGQKYNCKECVNQSKAGRHNDIIF